MMQNIVQPDLNILDFPALKPMPFDDSCITIGNFDGVHLGHQAIIQRMVQAAKQQAHPVLVITFYPNPYVFFNKPDQAYYLSTPREKERQLLALGVDQVITFRFDREFAALTAEAFLVKIKQALGLSVLVVGQDFALGKGRQGSIPVLKEIGLTQGFKVEIIPQIDLGDKEISSTRIRQRLDEGAVDQVAELLGRPYRVAGEVSHGSDRGARIGLPTANIAQWPQKKLPAVGVYATRVHLQGQAYYGITNVGFRPTFEQQSQVNVETHILDFSGDIYGERISLEFIKKVRDERKFSGVDEFLAQIERDKAEAKRIFQHG
jgi:riboflavin kinase/FMN adenylyltransferase